MQRHLGGVLDRPSAWRAMSTVAGGWMSRGFSMWSVVEKSSGLWIGRIGPWQPEGWPGTEVGWGLARAAWGKGYATEAATAAIDWAYATLGWTEVIHTIEASNRPSQAVARRLGSVVLRQAVLPPPLNLAVEVWGQSAEAWAARRQG